MGCGESSIKIRKEQGINNGNILMSTEHEFDPYILALLFPRPMLDLKILEKYYHNIIEIPTERYNEDIKMKEKIPCYFHKNKESSNILIIFHGNGSDMLNLPYYVSKISEAYKINVLIPEYPGYSIYRSIPSPEKCLENSLIVYDFILNNIQNITEKNIFIVGRSLGTSVAIYLASKRNPGGTFVISSFTTFASIGNRDEEDKNILCKYFRSIDYIDKINTPLLLIHGKIDNMVNYNESVLLYEKCNKNIIKELKLIDDIAHNFLYEDLRDKIIPCIYDFVVKNTLLNNNEKLLIEIDKKFYYTEEELNNLIKKIKEK